MREKARREAKASSAPCFLSGKESGEAETGALLCMRPPARIRRGAPHPSRASALSQIRRLLQCRGLLLSVNLLARRGGGCAAGAQSGLERRGAPLEWRSADSSEEARRAGAELHKLSHAVRVWC